MTDEELVRKMQRGDMQAFDVLYERYKDDAHRVACLITGNRADGEDLTPEAFVTAARSIGSLISTRSSTVLPDTSSESNV